MRTIEMGRIRPGDLVAYAGSHYLYLVWQVKRTELDEARRMWLEAIDQFGKECLLVNSSCFVLDLINRADEK